jgi:hypothetical protein
MPVLDREAVAPIEVIAKQGNYGAKAKEHRREVRVLSIDWIRWRKAINDHGPKLVHNREDRKQHADSEGQPENTLLHILALVKNHWDEEEEVSAS